MISSDPFRHSNDDIERLVETQTDDPQRPTNNDKLNWSQFVWGFS